MLGIFLIGIALSMDSFSVALSLGTLNVSNKKIISISLTIAIMHFFMPILGIILGNKLFEIVNINTKLVISIILLYLSYLMFNDSGDKKIVITSFINVFFLSFSVSLDSFSVGLGLEGLTNHYYLSAIVFSLCAGTITYMGLILGKYSIRVLKEKSKYLGAIILLIISIVNMCQLFTS